MTRPQQFAYPTDARSCPMCRRAAAPGTAFHGSRVCGSCLQQMNANLASKREIMFAFQD